MPARRLLIVNFMTDAKPGPLAWQYPVVKAMAACSEKVILLTHAWDGSALPDHVTVRVVPRLLAGRPGRWLGGLWMFGARLAAECNYAGINACFIHMNANWAYRLRPWLDRQRVPIVLWYAHPSAPKALHASLWAADRVVTSVPEAFSIPSVKVAHIGQGIDADVFALSARPLKSARLCQVGRITPSKNVDLLVETFACLLSRRPDVDFQLDLVGAPTHPGDQAYLDAILDRASALGVRNRIVLRGSISQSQFSDYYSRVFLALNLAGPHHSWDKTVLEALSCGCPVATRNRAFDQLLQDRPELRLDHRWTPEQMARRLETLYEAQSEQSPEDLRALVHPAHSLRAWVQRVVAVMDEARIRS